mgnify:FL=1|tara:strand:+ start:136 stop:330 length:195 start_codon:yes stop_codon:yes gene_type:complete
MSIPNLSKEQWEIITLLHKLPNEELCQMINVLGNIISERMRTETYLKEKYFEEQTTYEKDEEIP